MMNSSNNKRSKQKNHKTKAQLQQELSACKKNFKQANAKIANLEKKLLDSDLDKKELNQQQRGLDNIATQSDYQKKENEELKLVEIDAKPIPSEPKKETAEDISSSGSNFRIEIIPFNGNYHVEIMHPSANNSKIFEGLDKDGILDFIYRHLSLLDDSADRTLSPPVQHQTSQATKKEDISEVSSATDRISQSSSHVEKKIIQEVQIKQSNKFVEQGEFIRSRLPFSIYSRLHLQEAPSTENIDIDTPCYGIRATVMETGKDTPVVAEDVVDDLTLGVTEYENAVPIPGLNPGKYTIYIHTVVPFARIGEQQNIAIEVRN